MGVRLIILGAGKGTRMRSSRPKAMRVLGGKPLLAHVLDAVAGLSAAPPEVVVGRDADGVRAHFDDGAVRWCVQPEQLGTGDAVRCALDAMDVGGDERVVVLYADVPLLRAETIRRLAEALDDADVAFLTTRMDEPAGYGRVVRDAGGEVARIVEQADLSDATRDIREVNTGVMAARAERFRALLARVGNDNAQGEYYLTDCVGLAADEGLRVKAVVLDDATQCLGVNTPADLHRVERRLHRRRADELLAQGVVVRDADRLDVRGTVEAGRDVEIDVGVILEGDVRLGDGVHVGAHCVLKDVDLGAGTRVRPMTLMEGVRTGCDCTVGPFARIRPETELGDGVLVGNYVEVKNSRIGDGTKAGHLSYIGDATVGGEVNVGAGVITCNYDGERKHPTTIGDRVFVGSGTQIVAPVNIGDDATIGAGTTLTRDAEGGKLSLSRTPQKTVKGWRRAGAGRGTEEG